MKDDLFDLMCRAAEQQREARANGAKMVMWMNPTRTAWALEMERQGRLKRREDGLFHMDDMFKLWQETKDEPEKR